MSNVFVYGTLMFPEVLQVLLNRQPKATPAIVKGYSRHSLKGQVFPAVIPAIGSSQVQGLILYALTPSEMEVFDEFEGDEYVKTPIKAKIIIDDSASSVEDCDMYVWRDSLRSMVKSEPWDPENFKTKHLTQYAVMCGEFFKEFDEMRQASTRPFTFGDSVQ